MTAGRRDVHGWKPKHIACQDLLDIVTDAAPEEMCEECEDSLDKYLDKQSNMLMSTEGLHVVMGKAGDEAVKAQGVYGDFASMHEAYGVLAEEVAELFDAVRMRQSDTRRASAIEAEAIQLAAVALRIAEQAGRVTR